MILFRCVVPGKPVPQGRARTTRFGTFYPKTSKAWRKVLTGALENAHYTDTGRVMVQRLTIDVPVSLLVEIAGARANSDLDNHAKMVLDALQDAGVIVSDDVRTVRELVVRAVDGEPRTVVEIRRYEGGRDNA